MKKYIYAIIISFFAINFSQAQGFRDYLQSHDTQNFYTTKAYLDNYYETNDKGKGSGYKQYVRWLKDMEPDVFPTGEMINKNALINIANNRLQKSHSALPQNRSPHGTWKLEGPTFYTEQNGWNGGNGRVNRITFHPTQPNTYFACTPAGGLWRTQNNAVTWQCLTDGLPRIGAGGLVIDPQETNKMFLLTGDADASDQYSIGLLKTIDGGVTWSKTGLTWGVTQLISARNIVMHPTNHDTLYITTNAGLRRSLDGGATWATVQLGNFFDIEFQPNNPARMYATTFGDLYISTDHGANWTLKTDTDFPPFNTRIELAVTPADSTYLYLIYGRANGNSNYLGLYRSTDAGNDFDPQSTYPNILGYASNGSDDDDQGTYDLALTVDPNNEEIVYVGGINVWKSINGGVSWNITSYWNKTNNGIGYTHADIHALKWNNGSLFCGSDGGVFRTLDGGTNWLNLSEGLAIMQFFTVDVENNIILGGTQDNGTNQWFTTGNQTVEHVLGSDGYDCMIDTKDNNIRYGTTITKFKKSTNGGASFFDLNILNNVSYVGLHLGMHPVNTDTIYGAFYDFYRSYNGGSTWTDLNAGLGIIISGIAQSKANPNVMYAMNFDQVKRISNVHATTPVWNEITGTLTSVISALSCIDVDPDHENSIWIGCGGFMANEKIYFSNNGGTTWQNLSSGLPNVPVVSIKCEPGNSNGVYVGTDIGIFYRNDALAAWVYFSNGLPVTEINDLDIEGGRVYAATFGRGVWSSPLHTTCINGLFLSQTDAGNGIQIHKASSFINSNQIITGGLGTDIKYQSGSEITLTTGFHAMKDNLFHANLDGCQ